MIPLYKIPTEVVETESRLGVARAWEGWGGGGAPSRAMKYFGPRKSCGLHNVVNAINATGLYTLKWLIF